MIRTHYQEGNERNSSPTLEVGVFLLEEDKFYLFAWIGIVLNALTLLGIGGIVAVGVYGL